MRISPVTTQTAYPTYTFQAEKTPHSPGKKDVVTLSDEGKRLQAQNSATNSSLLGKLSNFMDGAGKDGVITLDEIRAFGEKYLNKAKDILAETLYKLGISSDHNITIRTDIEGVVRIESDLSVQDNDRLETALNEHPDFQQAFVKASSSQNMIDAAEKYLDFAKAYAQNPEAAIAHYGIGNSSSGPSGDYVLQYTQGLTNLFFKRDSL